MQDIGCDIERILEWFPHLQEAPYIHIRVSPEHTNSWPAILDSIVRRCYIADEKLVERAAQLKQELELDLESAQKRIIESKLPDPGPVMAGDFGEILIFLYQGAKTHPKIAVGPKKWRLKQDRTKAAPRSDVVHFIVPQWPIPSNQDEIHCAEVKLKSTAGAFSPIKAAIEGCDNDRTSRLAKTLVWLKDRAVGENLGSVSIKHLDRFIKATDYPPAKKYFSAVAIICSSLIQNELRELPDAGSSDYKLIVIEVPDLKNVYSSVFGAAKVAVVLPVPVTEIIM